MRLEVETDKRQWVLIPTIGWFGEQYNKKWHHIPCIAWLNWTIRLYIKEEKKW